MADLLTNPSDTPASDAPVELSGTVERVTYSNAENGYAILKFRTSGRDGLVTVTGTLAAHPAGQPLKLTGRWMTHPRFGLQFIAEHAEQSVPATVVGMERYLGSGLIKGLGPVMARRIVERFGAESLDVIEHAPHRLREVEGIGRTRIAAIKDAWDKQRAIKDVMVFLQSHGVSAAFATRIYRAYGRAAIETVRATPYRLAEEIAGIGFQSADRIALSVGIDPGSIERAEAGLSFFLGRHAQDGHVCFPSDSLVEHAARELAMDPPLVADALASLAASSRVMLEDSPDGTQLAYLAAYHQSECGIAGRMAELMRTPRAKAPRADALSAPGAKADGPALSPAQEAAVRLALAEKVCVITGGPGTGKTTVLLSIIRACRASGLAVRLAAPTGRAARRLGEVTGSSASTIHRLLEMNPREGRFMRDAASPLEADMVVVDEASMIDTVLMHHLLLALPAHAGLLLVGDVDQLPSVGAGLVLSDVIASGAIPTVRLAEVFRQAAESLIIRNAHLVNQGLMPATGFRPDVPQDFYFFEANEPEAVADKLVSLVAERMPAKFGLHPIRDIQVLCPTHRGPLGTVALNARLQEALNPSGPSYTLGETVFRTGDKLMQTVNDYDRDVFNGDMGTLAAILPDDGGVVVDFDGRHVEYETSDVSDLAPAYAITVHKSQGSEYPAVVIPVHTQHYIMLARNLLYTAITRGKRLVVLVGTESAIRLAVGNHTPLMRHGLLRERLAALVPSSQG